jgi:hypothetical protein
MYPDTYESRHGGCGEPSSRAQAAKRREDDARANAQRIAHGQPKRLRKLEAAARDKASRDLDQHRIEPGDRR